MRILILSSTYRPEVRGVATVIQQYSTALRIRGHKIYLVTRRLSGTPSYERLPNFFIFRVLPHNLSWTLYPKFLMKQFQIARHLIKKARFDAIHVITDVPLIPAVFLKVTYGLPLVFSPIGIPTERLLHHSRPSISTKFEFGLDRVLLSILLRFVDAVIVPSKFNREFFIDFYGRSLVKKIHIIPRCVNTHKIKYYSKKYEDNQSPYPLILCVGALWYRKGIDILLRAMPEVQERYPRARLQIVGGGNKGEYLKLADKLKIGSFVHFTGTVPHERIYAFYRKADIFVLPSRHRGEAFPNAVLEAMASGKPVIATKVGALSSLVKNGVTGLLVEPENPSKLARAIVHLASNKGLLQRMGMNGRRIAKENYSLQILADKLEETYQRMHVTSQACAPQSLIGVIAETLLNYMTNRQIRIQKPMHA